MTKLEVAAEVEGLGHDDVAVGLEHHLEEGQGCVKRRVILSDLPWRWDDRAGGIQ